MRLTLVLFPLATLTPLALIGLGLAWGGPWAWAALVWMGLAAVALDGLVPLALPESAPEAEFPGAEGLLLLLGSLAVLLTLALPAALPDLSAASLALTLAAGLWLGQVGHPAAHELIHRPGRLPRALGVAAYACMGMGHHASAHRLVHHLHVGTPQDPNSARAGLGFWRFLPRAWIGSFRAGLAAERARGSRAYLVQMGVTAAVVLAALVFGGGRGLLAWALLALHAGVQILLADYVQHYGLTRALRPDGRPEPVGPVHSWNAPHWASSAQMLNATRHSDHHLHPMRPYPALQLPTDVPRLPWPLPMAAVVALIPPLWHRRIRPRIPKR